MKKETKDTDLSLYCKQNTIESWHELPWACGFSSIVTAMRLLGDRTIRADQLPQRLRRLGGDPKDGIDAGDLVRLVREFGYGVRSFPERDMYYESTFKEWLRAAWRRNHPTVVAWTCSGDEHDHYVCAYSNPDDGGVWVMDPLEDEQVFEWMSWRNFLKNSADTSGQFCFWEAHEVVPKARATNLVPPSTALFEWINDLPGEVEEQDFVAAAFVDNFFDTVRGYEVTGSRRAMALSRLLSPGGLLWLKLDEWSVYYDKDDVKALKKLLEVAHDVDAYLDLKVDASRVPALVAELALLFTHSLMYWGWLEDAA